MALPKSIIILFPNEQRRFADGVQRDVKYQFTDIENFTAAETLGIEFVGLDRLNKRKRVIADCPFIYIEEDTR